MLNRLSEPDLSFSEDTDLLKIYGRYEDREEEEEDVIGVQGQSDAVER
jgi:hypothetical protein